MSDQRDRRFVRESIDSGLFMMQGDPRLAQRIMDRERTRGSTLKKRLSAGFVLAILLMLFTVSALAAAKGSNVLQFLFGRQSRDLPEIPVTAVHQEAAADGAFLQVDSAVYDGRALAFDWLIENRERDIPMYCRVEDFTANGVRIWTDGTDSFHEQWIPGLFSDGAWQDGEYILLPAQAQGADQLHIDMRVTLYRPVRPVWRMEAFQPEEAAELAAEGYYVIAEGEGFVGYDAGEGAWRHWYGGIPAEDMGGYQTETLVLSFDIGKLKADAGKLETEAVYENEHCTAVYETAQITPLGLYLTVRMTPKDTDFKNSRMMLTDGEGRPLAGADEDRFFPSVGEEYGRDGNALRIAQYVWNGITAKDLPDTISLTCFLSDGEIMVFPVGVRR